MNSFSYQMPVQVYFGAECIKNDLANELKKYGKNIMMAYGGGSIKKNGIYADIVEELQRAGKNIIEFGGITANPTYEKVLEGIALYKQEQIDFILAVGGGSVIDCCKVIAAGAKTSEDIWKMEIEENRFPQEMADFGAIVTLSGAGAEMDNLGAVCYEKKNQKKTFVGPYAKFVCLNPEYLMTVPLATFMPGVYDSLTHCLETYFGNGYNVSDDMNLGLMKNIVRNMKELIKGHDTLEIRSDLMWDASLVQTFLFNVGKPGDFQGHQIENCLGAYSHQTHGKQLAVILPHYYEMLYPYDVKKFALLAKEVMGVDDPRLTELETAKKGLEALISLIQEAHLPLTFQEMGYDLSDDIAKIVSQTCGVVTTNAHPLTRHEIYDLLIKCK